MVKEIRDRGVRGMRTEEEIRKKIKTLQKELEKTNSDFLEGRIIGASYMNKASAIQYFINAFKWVLEEQENDNR